VSILRERQCDETCGKVLIELRGRSRKNTTIQAQQAVPSWWQCAYEAISVEIMHSYSLAPEKMPAVDPPSRL
jgi:hypothetical protein